MGKLIYNGVEAEFDDRTLMHLQLVIGAKLRRGESLFFSWNDPPNTGNGRSCIWLQSCIPLLFQYDDRTLPSLNRAWIELLVSAANSASGLVPIAEPQPPNATRAGNAEA